MKTYYCKRCNFHGTRTMVRKHLREEHLLNKKGNPIMQGNFYSIDEYGNKGEYIIPKKKQ
jgi:hypothetical protein